MRANCKNKCLFIFDDYNTRRLTDNLRYFFYLNKHYNEFNYVWIIKETKIWII